MIGQNTKLQTFLFAGLASSGLCRNIHIVLPLGTVGNNTVENRCPEANCEGQRAVCQYIFLKALLT